MLLSIRSIVFCAVGMLLAGHAVQAQPAYTYAEDGGYQFEIKQVIDHTPVKDQNRSGTCWSFAGISFLESELMRMGEGEHNLSDMFVVRKVYEDKADRYVRMHGKLQFSPGGAFHDVTHVLDHYGIVPEQAYQGNQMVYDKPVHGEMDAVLKNYVKAVTKNPNGKLTKVWDEGYNNVLDAYMGEVPEEFTYEGETYTPESFAEAQGLNADNYVELSSYSHHPFYSRFILSVPDNWMQAKVHNVPMDELVQITNKALQDGYSVGWGCDVSQKGFSHRNSVAINPEKSWEAMTEAEVDSAFHHPVPQAEVTQEKRQETYNNYQTTDDHMMHLTGLAEDQNGNPYYLVKNSWGQNSNQCGGYLYATESYFKAKTLTIVVHKDAIPDGIADKLDL